MITLDSKFFGKLDSSWTGSTAVGLALASKSNKNPHPNTSQSNGHNNVVSQIPDVCIMNH
jgi:hypothetical protein